MRNTQRAGAANHAQTLGRHALSHAAAHPFQALSTLTFAAGVLLMVPLFLELGELPQLDVPSMVPLVATMAAGGLGAVLFLMGLPIAGGWLTRTASVSQEWRSDAHALCIYVLPGAMYSMGLLIHLWQWPGQTEVMTWMVWATTGLGPVWTLARVLYLGARGGQRTALVEGGLSMAWFSSAMALLIVYVVTTTIAVIIPRDAGWGWLVFSVLCCTVYAAAVIVAAIKSETAKAVRNMGWAIGAAVVLLLSSGGLSALSGRLLSQAGWANYPAKLFVSDRGCDLINRSIGRNVCQLGAGPGGNLVCPVIVRSRIGSPIHLALAPASAAGRWPDQTQAVHVSLPKEDLIVSQRIEPPKMEGIRGAASDAPLAWGTDVGEVNAPWLSAQCGGRAGRP